MASERLSALEQFHDTPRSKGVGCRNGERVYAMAVFDHRAWRYFPRRHRSRMASPDLRRGSDDSDESLWHDLLLTRRTARISRHVGTPPHVPDSVFRAPAICYASSRRTH